jgi:hypothetical protein
VYVYAGVYVCVRMADICMCGRTRMCVHNGCMYMRPCMDVRTGCMYACGLVCTYMHGEYVHMCRVCMYVHDVLCV